MCLSFQLKSTAVCLSGAKMVKCPRGQILISWDLKTLSSGFHYSALGGTPQNQSGFLLILPFHSFLPRVCCLSTHQGHQLKYELIMSFPSLNSSNGYIYNGTKPKFLRKALYSSLISSCTTLFPTPPAPPACLPSLKHCILISAFWPLPLLFCLLGGSQHQCHLPRETFQTFPASLLGSSYPHAASDLFIALASIQMYLIVSMAIVSIYYNEGFSRDRDF